MVILMSYSLMDNSNSEVLSTSLPLVPFFRVQCHWLMPMTVFACVCLEAVWHSALPAFFFSYAQHFLELFKLPSLLSGTCCFFPFGTKGVFSSSSSLFPGLCHFVTLATCAFSSSCTSALALPLRPSVC